MLGEDKTWPPWPEGSDAFREAVRREPLKARTTEWFAATHPLGPQGERMLAELNAASERASVWPIDDRDRLLISELNECRVRDRLGLEQVPPF